jgi:cytoskeletal protein CcmA (bactofilin family)
MRVARGQLTIVVVAFLALLLASSSAAAAVIIPDDGDVYRLEQGQVIDDDLYVSAPEVIIDGTVNGDLVAAGAHVEVNGVVTGDVLAAGASVVINGVVEDDARVAGAAVEINGTVGSDLLAAAGGGEGFTFPFNVGTRSILPGLRIAQDATIGKDALLAGGLVIMNGTVGRNLYVGAGSLVLAGTVNGDAWLYTGNLAVSDAATVEGTLSYSAGEAARVPASVASQVEEIPAPARPEQPVAPTSSILADWSGWLLGTVLLLVGLALFGWLLLRFAPGLLAEPTAAVAAKPAQAFIIGLVVFLLILPVSALLVAVTALFFGIFPAGVAMFFFLFGLLALLWVFSPMAPGLWIGRAISGGRWSDVLALLTGIVIIALAARLIALVPYTGAAVAFLIYLVCFSFTAGGLYLSRRQQVAPPVETDLAGEPEPVG